MSRGSVDRHTAHSQPMNGTPCEVPLPSTVQRLGQLVTDLDSEEFTVREQASAELGKLGHFADPALRKAVLASSSLEVRRRAERLLDRLAGPIEAPEIVRLLRAVEAVCGHPDAVALLGVKAAREQAYAPACVIATEAAIARKPRKRPTLPAPSLL